MTGLTFHMLSLSLLLMTVVFVDARTRSLEKPLCSSICSQLFISECISEWHSYNICRGRIDRTVTDSYRTDASKRLSIACARGCRDTSEMSAARKQMLHSHNAAMNGSLTAPTTRFHDTCEQKCVSAGHCCTGTTSGCQKPSCAMGCLMAEATESEASCNATCVKACNQCSYKLGNITLYMCGDCAARWLDPTTMKPVIVPEGQPWWPPGWGIGGCGSCDDVSEECQLGCVIANRPSFTPQPPPPPSAPPPTPVPDAPVNATLNFSATLSSYVVLQQAPMASAVYGFTGSASDAAVVDVVVAASDRVPDAGMAASNQTPDVYTVRANVSHGRWKALLRPTPASQAVSYTVSAICRSGCTGNATLHNVVFGEVWYWYIDLHRLRETAMDTRQMERYKQTDTGRQIYTDENTQTHRHRHTQFLCDDLYRRIGV
eukprot:m.1091562 g.1091562  ORF g.1091562 m.1091562 type:complete len:431 (-) comp24290_c0_seq3:2614-3906(-)